MSQQLTRRATGFANAALQCHEVVTHVAFLDKSCSWRKRSICALKAVRRAVFVHASFMHLLGNMLLFGVLGGILERRYGALRMLLVMALSAFGAAFFAGAFADECTQVRPLSQHLPRISV